MGSGSRSFAVMHHMFVQSEQCGYEYCWIWCIVTKVGWPDGGECGVVDNNVPISVYDGCELFARV